MVYGTAIARRRRTRAHSPRHARHAHPQNLGPNRHRANARFEIAEAIQRRSRSVLQVEEGSLYPALQRMLVKGWIAGVWGHTPERRRARYYRISAAGRKQLERELESYKRVTAAVALIIQSA